MTILVDDLVHSIAIHEPEAVAVREAVEILPEPEDNAKVLTAVTLVALNVLLVAGIGVNIAAAPILSWILAIGLAASSQYTVNQFKKMFGTTDSIAE